MRLKLHYEFGDWCQLMFIPHSIQYLILTMFTLRTSKESTEMQIKFFLNLSIQKILFNSNIITDVRNCRTR